MRDYLYAPLLWNDEIRVSVWYPSNCAGSKDDDMTFYRALAKLPMQTHSLNVGIVDRVGQQFPDTDALVTFDAEIPLGVVTADCVPIMLYASDVKGIAAVHAGWKGSLGGILDRTLDELIIRGAAPENTTAIFGPSVSMKHYEVSRELAERFVEAGFGECVSWPDDPEGNPHLDLQEVNRRRLLSRGVPDDRIITCGVCTFDAVKMGLQSYRRDGESAGRNLTLIALTDN